ncbi:MAG: histone deacetylase family protein [Rhodobacteraceae bacterium]|nr:histone deacetylase family protein [Paracoccaceae bacterium]
MRAFFDPRQLDHDPQMFIKSGAMMPNPEQPERARVLRAGAEAAGAVFETPSHYGMAPLVAVHSPEYLWFLQTIHGRWQRLPNATDEVIPNVHPIWHPASYPTGAVGQAGYHQADTACPIAAGTWTAAYWSAQTAVSGAQAVLDGETAYALSRPPGHHAFSDKAGGFCFLNNAAIAAQVLCTAGRRPAILDVDVHHGNGTQGIFYERGDVLTVSIHADPSDFYPFFWGHTSERGAAEGAGCNLNLPVPFGTDDAAYMPVLDTALAAIAAFNVDVLVVSLGLDAFEGDPFQALKITTSGFCRMGERIAATGLPLLIVQEGGYLCDDLGANLSAFLTGVQDA